MKVLQVVLSVNDSRSRCWTVGLGEGPRQHTTNPDAIVREFSGSMAPARIVPGDSAITHTISVLLACVLLFAVFTSAASQASEASQAADGGMSPELVKALIAIDLSKEQRGPFGAELRQYSADMQAAIGRITRRRTPDQPLAIKRKTRSLTKAMDKAMRKILRDEQWPAYEAYKTEFVKPPQLQAGSTELEGPLNNH